MVPSLHEGERVLVLKTSNVKHSDIVVARTSNREVIKRVVAEGPSWIFVEGDNNENSTDSRHYGAIGRDKIIGKVIFKY